MCYSDIGYLDIAMDKVRKYRSMILQCPCRSGSSLHSKEKLNEALVNKKTKHLKNKDEYMPLNPFKLFLFTSTEY